MLPRATPRPSGAGDVLTNAGSRETTICCHAVKHHVTREKKREEMIKLARGGPSQSWLLGRRLNRFDPRSCVDHLRHESERDPGRKGLRDVRWENGAKCSCDHIPDVHRFLHGLSFGLSERRTSTNVAPSAFLWLENTRRRIPCCFVPVPLRSHAGIKAKSVTEGMVRTLRRMLFFQVHW